MIIVADDKIPFLKGALEPYAEVIYVPGKMIDNDVLKKADALLIRTRTKCTKDLLDGTNIKFIGTATIGYDHIDTQYCERNDITWTNAPGCNSSSVQQYITSALLKLSMDKKYNLKGKTIGIIGVGNVGTKVEKIARILGMKILLNDPPRARKEGNKNFVLLGNILYESDFITVHVPLNMVDEDCTYHLFNEKSFKKMKKGTWFLNTSRGEVTDSLALKNAVKSGKLGGAVIDVWENEPDIDLELMEYSFIATPHIAGYSSDGKANGTSVVVNSLSRHFGLSLHNWYPMNVPPPPVHEIFINGGGKSEEEIVREAVFHTYDIEEDDFRLRMSPSDFEKQRGEYRVRREFPSYTVKLHNCTKESYKILEDLGFRIIG